MTLIMIEAKPKGKIEMDKFYLIKKSNSREGVAFLREMAALIKAELIFC